MRKENAFQYATLTLTLLVVAATAARASAREIHASLTYGKYGCGDVEKAGWFDGNEEDTLFNISSDIE